ncbi:MAG: hypothetical protein EPO61_11050 [Nitrospirae bacterium]|nr:MAG: hypothetical protein EPO61_11050 [Nitrospirota bacterium]
MNRSLLYEVVVVVGLCGALAGCAPVVQEHPPVTTPDARTALGLTAQDSREHRAVMLQHLETVQAIVAALAEEDFVRAQGLTEAHLGFFMHRQAMAGQHPESFPPAYHDLAMAHHEAAEALARTMPSRDLKQILPKLDGVLKACVACHLSFKVNERS